ncbi:MAG: ABC transporter ATP-binding protein [Propionibacteriaceae bacterium]|jgi:putative ABC transport system ATP-binding protein|nr:ABC transporter ATP-binding protein [Propionibacteriaceae bacterium]
MNLETQAPSLVASLVGVTRSFPTVLAVKDVTLTIRRGDYLSIMGPSGSGKSTLLNILGLLDRPTIGTYSLDGFATDELSERDRALLRGTRLGFVFQAYHLLPRLTVADNVMLGMAYSGLPKIERLGRAEQALVQVGIDHRSNFYPRTLSGGERQRVAIARAIAGGPTILLADEPTGNLDSRSASGVMRVLDELHEQGLTLIVVTHDQMVGDRASTIHVMRDGRLVDQV